MDPITVAALISSIANVGGGFLQGAGQEAMSEEQRRHQLQTLLAQLENQSGQYEQTRQDNAAKVGLETANTTPDRVKWRQNMAMRNAIAPNIRNFSVSTPGPLQGYRPNITGGMRLPENGFGPDTLKFFSENAMLEGEKDLDLAGGRAAGGNYQTPSYGAIYGNQNAQDTQSHVETANSNLKQIDEAAAFRRRMAMQNALGPNSLSNPMYARGNGRG